MTTDARKPSKEKDRKILLEAKKRFTKCEAWEAIARENWLLDWKFYNGDSRNHFQWDTDIRKARDVDKKPTLTVNKTRQHCLQIINDARQNKPSVKVRPAGDEATYDAAQVFDGVVRHIEYISNAQSVYDHATTHQVASGIGYWRIVSQYLHDDTLDQEVLIQRINDPTGVFMDPQTKESDGSDARFAFIFTAISRDEYNAQYGEQDEAEADEDDGSNSFGPGISWRGDDLVKVAEYYRIITETDTLVAIPGGVIPAVNDTVTAPKSKLPELFQSMGMSPDEAKALVEMLPDIPEAQTRDIQRPIVEWYKIVGDRIVDRSIWPGTTIPIVPLKGEEYVIDGIMDRRGHVRALIDPQRMYNYWTSAATEGVALQTKVPWITPIAAIEGQETYWFTANTQNHSVLPWNHVDDEGRPIPPPQRAPVAAMSDAYIKGMQMTQNEMMLVSGQYQAVMGQASNETSGKAINARQRQGDNATYHYIDHLGRAIRRTGKILIEVIPKFYDTKRVVQIMAQGGQQKSIQVDPDAPQAHQSLTNDEDQEDKDAIVAIFNPNIGRYDVEADIGPAYETRRQEAFNAFTQIVGQNNSMLPMIGDLMFQAADFPMADEIAERFKEMRDKAFVPAQAAQQLQEQLQQMQGTLAKMLARNAELETKVSSSSRKDNVDAYRAETDRLAVVNDVDPNLATFVVRGIASEAAGVDLHPLVEASALLTHGAALTAPEPILPPPSQPSAQPSEGM